MMGTHVTHSVVHFVNWKHSPTDKKWKVLKNSEMVKRIVRQEYVNVSDHGNSKGWRFKTPHSDNSISLPRYNSGARITGNKARLQGNLRLGSIFQVHKASIIFVKMSSAFTLAEVSSHNTTADLWIIINDEIYDMTEFQKTHPGGDKSMSFFDRSRPLLNLNPKVESVV
jgi:cytochrome b involved in lipid metabolism